MCKISSICRYVNFNYDYATDAHITCCQKYANELSSSSAIDQDTIHLLFPGLNKLLDFQRRFLIKLEGVAELPWKEQRWGLPFVENVRLVSIIMIKKTKQRYPSSCGLISIPYPFLLSLSSGLITMITIHCCPVYSHFRNNRKMTLRCMNRIVRITQKQLT